MMTRNTDAAPMRSGFGFPQRLLRLGRFLPLLLLVLIFAACAPKKKSQDATSSPSLTIGAMSSMDFLPFAVAQETGIYDSLGLKLEIVHFFSANDRDAALQAGKLDGTVTDYTGAALQVAGGVDAGLVMKLDGDFSWMAYGAESDDFPKSFGVSNNTVIDFLTDRFTQPAVAKGAVVHRVEVQKIPLRLELLLQGKLGAAVLPEPFATMAEASGRCGRRDVSSAHQWEATGLLVKRELAQEGNNKALSLLLQGYNLAVQKLRDADTKTLARWIKDYAGAPEKLAAHIPVPDYTPATQPKAEELQAAIAWLKQKKALKKDLTPQQLIVPMPALP